jgi:hypothetical protein
VANGHASLRQARPRERAFTAAMEGPLSLSENGVVKTLPRLLPILARD